MNKPKTEIRKYANVWTIYKRRSFRIPYFLFKALNTNKFKGNYRRL